jgi:cell division protein FtsI (penicillin-binding protein 3)
MRLMNPHHKRLLWLALLVFSLFSLLIIQFYRLQIIEGEYWSKKALKQHYLVIKEPFHRGIFYANNHLALHSNQNYPLVMDVPKYHLYIDPIGIPTCYQTEIALFLIDCLQLPTSEQTSFTSHFQKKSRSRKIASNLDKEFYESIQKWWKVYARERSIARNALFFMKDYQRSYPYKALLGQVLHTIKNVKNEKTDQATPTGGLELYFNRYLQGKVGKRRLLRSPTHSFETGEVISKPENGADIYLTINPYIQAIAEEELEKGVKKCQAKAGWAVLANPYNGEILALAQYPFFSPSDYKDYFNDTRLIEHSKVKSITDANEPGSTAKPFTIALALKANQILKSQGKPELISPQSKINCSNGRFPGRSKPISDTRSHPYLNMSMAMWKSSNIYMARLAEKMVNSLGSDWYRSQLQQVFGIGVKTGLELPAESSGVLPKPGKRHPNGTFEWSTATPFSIAFGHNMQMSSLQLVRAYSILANGGYLVQPTLIRKIIKTDSEGNSQLLIDNTQPKNYPRVLESDIVRQVVEMMKYVTKSGGTATKGDIPGYTEVGKSSTAKKIINGAYSEKLYIGSFIGFAPAENPAFVLIVTMDEPLYGYIPGVGKNHNGGNCAATVFRQIGLRTLQFLGIPPDDFQYKEKQKGVWVPETKKLQELYDLWNKRVE